jgi:hypothetical protein
VDGGARDGGCCTSELCLVVRGWIGEKKLFSASFFKGIAVEFLKGIYMNG